MKFTKSIALLFVITSAFMTQSVHAEVNQERWAMEYSPGIEGVYSPLFGSNKDLGIGSSFNEPRATETHKGVDQSAPLGTSVGPMWGTSRVIDNTTISSTIKSQLIRSYNANTGKLFYSLYLHLDHYNPSFPEDTLVSLSDVTAYSGNTGPAGTPAHLHFELLDSISITGPSSGQYSADYNSRVGVNPATHMTPSFASYSTSTWKKLSVFKSVTQSGSKITVEAWDSDLNAVAPLNEMKIYFKMNGSSSYGVGNMTKVDSQNWSYTFSGGTGSYADYFIIGRRSSSERWSAYPIKRYDLGTDSSGLNPSPNTCGCSYDTVRVSY